jgi:hypothetical protein
MRTYWIGFLFMALAWACAFFTLSVNTAEMPWRIVMSALFYAIFFMVPLFRNNPVGLTIILSIASVIAVIALWPESGSSPNLYPLLVFTLLAAAYRLPTPHAIGVGVILMLVAMSPYLWGYHAVSPIFIGLYSLLLAAAFVVFRKTRSRHS